MATNGHTHLGDRIRTARREAGFRNVETLAVQLDKGARTVQRWEQGVSEPSIAQLRQIAALTNRPLSYFIGEVAA